MGSLITPTEIAEDRATAEAEMIDTCRVTRPARADDPGYFEPVFNDETGQYDEAPPVVVYEGKFRQQVRADINANAVEGVVGEHEGMYRTSVLQFPITAGPDDVGDTSRIEPNCTLLILTSPLDATRVGAVINVMADTKGKTAASHRRMRGREVLS